MVLCSSRPAFDIFGAYQRLAKGAEAELWSAYWFAAVLSSAQREEPTRPAPQPGGEQKEEASQASPPESSGLVIFLICLVGMQAGSCFCLVICLR